MTPHTILTLARAVISDEHNWTQGVMRRTSLFGDTRRCSIGAIFEISNTHDCIPPTMVAPAVAAAMRFLAEATPNYLSRRAAAQDALRASCYGARPAEANIIANVIASFNDTHPHSDVLALFDRAIEAARPVEDVVDEIVPEDRAIDMGINGGVLHIPHEVFEFETTLELTDEFMALLDEAMTREPVSV